MTFKGHFEGNFKDGGGTIFYEATGVKIVGNWDADFLCGTGTITWPDGNALELEWEQGGIIGMPTSRSGCYMY